MALPVLTPVNIRDRGRDAHEAMIWWMRGEGIDYRRCFEIEWVGEGQVLVYMHLQPPFRVNRWWGDCGSETLPSRLLYVRKRVDVYAPPPWWPVE